MQTDWYNPNLTAAQRVIAEIRLTYGSLHAPSWLEMPHPPRPRFAVGQTVLAALPPLDEGGAPPVIVGKVERIARDYIVTLEVLACRGDVAGHHGDDWTPGDKAAVNDFEIYLVLEDFDG